MSAPAATEPISPIAGFTIAVNAEAQVEAECALGRLCSKLIALGLNVDCATAGFEFPRLGVQNASLPGARIYLSFSKDVGKKLAASQSFLRRAGYHEISLTRAFIAFVPAYMVEDAFYAALEAIGDWASAATGAAS